MSDDSLQAKAREAMQGGFLPMRSPNELWGGPATGSPCAVCGASTASGQVELELEFTSDSHADRTTYRVHPRCFSIFKLELDASTQDQTQEPASTDKKRRAATALHRCPLGWVRTES